MNSEGKEVKVELFLKGANNGDLDDIPLGKSTREFLPRSETDFVGLMNQGATCYLNSLMQSLFMTSVFSRELMRWKYEESKHGSRDYCIPLQLQILFGRLALSKQSAVGTKALTKSFQWDNDQSFQQHDIQELMRVLSDALERSDPKLRSIGELFQGSTVDFIKCPCCNYARERQDQFSDLSVNIKDMDSLDKALRNFVEPEVLSGDNLWRCSGCNEKVAAVKGVSLSSLPKILTIHLKRFMYDPFKRGRVKLHHKVEFPKSLDMAQYLPESANKENLVYNLYAILMHSGTATGGHYFAYIWSTKHSKWVEFNDSVVCFIEEETAMKNAFGGVENGMSAYLLMYSQLDLSASESTTQAVPDDIRLTVEAEDRAWEQEKAEIEAERRRLDLFVSYKNVERKYRFDMGVTVGHVQEHLRKDFGLEDQFPMDQVRLRLFAPDIGFAQQAFTGMEEKTLEQAGFLRTNNLLLETRAANESFPPYNPDEFPVRLWVVDASNAATVIDQMDEPLVRDDVLLKKLVSMLVNKLWTMGQFKESISHTLNIPLDLVSLFRLQGSKAECFTDNSIMLESLVFRPGQILYVEACKPGESALAREFEERRCQITIEYNHPDQSDPQRPKYENMLRLSKTETIAKLKDRISEVINIPAKEFRLRSSCNGPQFKEENATLEKCHLTDHSIVFVQRGRPLLKGEYDVQFLFYDMDRKKKFEFLFEIPVHGQMLVRDLKAVVLKLINQVKPARVGNEYGITYMRLREKLNEKVGKIFTDELSLGRNVPRLQDGFEIVVQKIEAPEKITKETKSIFLQRVFADTKKLGAKQEVVVRTLDLIGVLKDVIASLHPIERKCIGIAKGITYTEMTYDQAAKLNFEDPKLTDTVIMSLIPIRDGDLILFRDLSEKSGPNESPTGSTPDEKKKSRFSKVTQKKPVSVVSGPPRREVGIRIETEAEAKARKEAAEAKRIDRIVQDTLNEMVDWICFEDEAEKKKLQQAASRPNGEGTTSSTATTS